MNVDDLLTQSLQLLGLGMGSVFVILTMLIGIITLISRIVPEVESVSAPAPARAENSPTTQSTEHIAAIQAAIHQYRRQPHPIVFRVTLMTKPLLITDLVLRDASQSLLATRVRIEDMLPIAEKLDKVGFWSLETWGGATFDACIRFLGEDPWERLRKLKAAMPNTPMQMLLRGQNALGYRHYADDVIEAFVDRAAENGMDVFRIFDAMNDMRNIETAIKATAKTGKHAQGAISYTLSPVHNNDYWVDLAKRLEDMGSNSICIKDMAWFAQTLRCRRTGQSY